MPPASIQSDTSPFGRQSGQLRATGRMRPCRPGRGATGGGVLAARRVIVGQDDDMAPGQRPVVRLAPSLAAPWSWWWRSAPATAAGRRPSRPRPRTPARPGRRPAARAAGRAAGEMPTLQIQSPGLSGSGRRCRKVFRLVPGHLEDQLAGRVHVVVGGDDRPELGLALRSRLGLSGSSPRPSVPRPRPCCRSLPCTSRRHRRRRHHAGQAGLAVVVGRALAAPPALGAARRATEGAGHGLGVHGSPSPARDRSATSLRVAVVQSSLLQNSGSGRDGKPEDRARHPGSAAGPRRPRRVPALAVGARAPA